MLCDKCNRALGQFNESKEVLDDLELQAKFYNVGLPSTPSSRPANVPDAPQKPKVVYNDSSDADLLAFVQSGGK